jgi:hypothetical protein
MAMTKAITELFRVSDDKEYKDTFWTIYPAVEAGVLYALEAQEKELLRLRRIIKAPPPSEN